VSRRLRTEVAQLSVVSGLEQEDVGDTSLVEASSIIPPRTSRGNLYLLVQVSGEPTGKESIHRQLTELMSNEYSRVPGGITNGLRQAVKAANGFLHQMNLDSLPLWHRVGETCCAVLRGDDLYMAVAGDARIHVVKKGEVHSFPPPGADTAPDGLPAEPRSTPPLGADEFLTEVGLYHCLVEEGDIIVLASSGLTQVATQWQVAEAAQGGLDELSHTLRALASHADLSAILIQIFAAERSAAPIEERSRLRPSVAPTQPSRRPVSHTKPHKIRRPVTSIPGRLAAAVLALCARILESFARLAEHVQAFLSWTVSSGLLGRVGRGIKSGVVSLFQGLGILTERMLPEPHAAPTTMETVYDQPIRGVRTAQKDKGSRLPLIVVFVIITLVAAGSLSLVLRRQSNETRFAQSLTEATAALDLARGSQDTATIKLHLDEALDLVEQALLVKPANEEAIALRDEIFVALDEAEGVLRLQFSAQAPLAGPLSQAHRVLLHENELYVLDTGTPELRRYQVNEIDGTLEPPGGSVLLSPDNSPAGLEVQGLTDLAWVGSGSGRETESLLLLVNGSSLLQLDEAQGITTVSVADSEIWNDPRAIEGYSGYLYVLDAAEDRILKYAPTENTYDSFPVSYLQGEAAVELENAVDMAIDGFIYVLLTGGDILKFSGGLQVDFSVTGLGDQGLQGATALYTDPDTQHIYVADAGLARIVQLTKDGVFVRQFLPPREEEELFQGLQDVWVDEIQGELVVLTSDGLFVAPVEQPPSTLQ
jgi:hypothetical protein